jgi:hypothetical protein
MSREAVELQLVNYYAREGYYHHLQVCTSASLRRALSLCPPCPSVPLCVVLSIGAIATFIIAEPVAGPRNL